MPGVSGGNRWVGVLAFAPLPVPPPLHRIARDRITARTQGSSFVEVDGRRVPAHTAWRALILLGRVLGTHDDLLRQATCLALARALRRTNARPETWPSWAQNAVLAYATHPDYFESPKGQDLRAWQLGSNRRRAEGAASERREAPRKPIHASGSRSMASHGSVLPVRVPPDTGHVSVASPVMLDPGEVLDDSPQDHGLEKALTQAGWHCDNVLRRRWLRLAVVHASYLYEHQGDLPINAEFLRMLDSLGSRWCRLYMLESFAARAPLASAQEQHRAWAGYSVPMAEQLGEFLGVDQAIRLGRGEALTSRDPHRRKRTHVSVTWQIIGVVCLLGGLPAVSKLTKTVYQDTVSQIAPATNWVQVLNMHGRGAGLAWECRKSGPDHQAVFEAMVTDRRGRRGKGSSNTKSGARSAAAEDYVRRHMPAVTRAEAKTAISEQPSRLIRPAALYTNVGGPHEQAFRSLRKIFELPPSADALLSQALTHASWAYEHKVLVEKASQRDCTALAHLGSVVADALIAHEQASRVVARTLTPTEDEARLMTPRDQRLWDLFEDRS